MITIDAAEIAPAVSVSHRAYLFVESVYTIDTQSIAATKNGATIQVSKKSWHSLIGEIALWEQASVNGRKNVTAMIPSGNALWVPLSFGGGSSVAGMPVR